MSALGTLPTKTDVQITISGSGEPATIRAATPSAAGVMTAEHARVVETVRLMLAAGQFEAPAAVPLGQQASTLPIGDLSLPPPKQQVLDPLPPGHGDDVLRRLQALEARATSNGDYASLVKSLTAFRDQVAARLDQIEKRLLALEAVDSAGLKQEVHTLKIEFESGRLASDLLQQILNDQTPVMVENDN